MSSALSAKWRTNSVISLYRSLSVIQKVFPHFFAATPCRKSRSCRVFCTAQLKTKGPTPVLRLWAPSSQNTLQRNLDSCIPRKGIARHQPKCPHSCVCERSIYWSTYFPSAEYADRSCKYINRTQKHECRNWDCGRPVPILGIYVSNYRNSFFAVHAFWRQKNIESPL